MKKLDRRVRKTKQSLKNSLINLIEEKNFSSITVTDIVNRSDVNRSTFYAHFQDKEELLACIMDELIEGLINSIKTTTSKIEHDQLDQCIKSSIHVFNYVAEHAKYFKTMMNGKKFPEFTIKLSDNLYNFYLHEIKKYQQHNKNFVINIEIFANYLTSIVVGFIYHWVIKSDMKYSPDYFAKELTKIFTSKSNVTYLHPMTIPANFESNFFHTS